MPDADVIVQDTPLDLRPPTAAGAMGLGGSPAAPPSRPAAPNVAPAVAMAPQGSADVRSSTVKFWMAQGAPEHVAEGIADRLNVESGLKPDAYNPDDRGSPSGGLYQHHAERLEKLKAFAQQHNQDWRDPAVQNAYAGLEVKAGLDPIASAHWKEIVAAPDRKTAEALWTRYFERPLQGWASSASPALQARADALQGEASRLRDEYHTDAQELMREANSAPAGSKQRDDAIAKMREREREYGLKYEEIASHPPALKPVDAMANFGSAGTVIALLGGLFARRHITAALGAAGQAMQAINQNNYEKFQVSYKTWEQQSTTALNMVKLHNEQIRELIDDKKMAEDEKNARLRVMFESLGMTRQADAMALGVNERVFTDISAMERAQQSAAQNKQAMQVAVASQLEAKHIADNMPPAEAHAQAMREAGLIPGGAQDTPGKGREADLKKIVDADVVKFKEDHPDASQADLDAARYESRLKHEKELGTASRPPRSAPAMALQQFIEEKTAKDGRPPTAAEIQTFAASSAEKTAEGRSVGTRSANLEMAANAAEAIMPLLEAESNKIDRTQYPTINKLILAYEEGTGDPEVVRYGELINSMRYLYARALSPTGQARVTDLKNFDKIMNEAWSKGQISGGLDQIKQSITAERGAIARTRAEVSGGGVGASPSATTPIPPAALPAGVPPGSKKLSQTYQGYTVYEAPDGKRYADRPDASH